jgi:hypothetical protein
VFIDVYENGMRDTIRLVIPNQKAPVTQVKQVPKEEKQFLETISSDSTENAKKEIGKDEITKGVEHPISAPIVNKAPNKNTCVAEATETDFFKLRKKLAAETNDDNMVTEAKKYFKLKCFSVAQLKNLSSMFLDDGGKYKFFDAAYSYVVDKDNFASLQSEIKDDYYVNRFKAMLHN